MEFDLVISNGTIIDGTGAPRCRADLGIAKGRIAAIVKNGNGPLSGAKKLDAAGKIVAPGFIDIHSHSDWILPLPDHSETLAPLLLQGITTVVTGNCGFSPAPVVVGQEDALDELSEVVRRDRFPYHWRSFAEFLDTMERSELLLNAAFLVGHSTIRQQALREQPREPTPAELETMKEMTRSALRDGAFGFSVGLSYAPGLFAKNDELLALLKIVAAEGGLFATHHRAYTWVSPFFKPMLFGTPHNVRSVREMIGLAREAGVRLQLSHQFVVGRRTWHTYPAVLQEIEQGANDGVDVAFDLPSYCTAGNTTIQIGFPDWFLARFEENIHDPVVCNKWKRGRRLENLLIGYTSHDTRVLSTNHPELDAIEGLDLAAIGERLHMSPEDAFLHIARETQGKARIAAGTQSGDDKNEEPLQATLSHSLCSFETDSILTGRGVPSLRGYGNMPRVLGRYSRDLGLFSLEDAIRRMTSYSAERVGLKDMGRIAEGYWADLTIFDPKTVRDNTSPDRGPLPPTGIHAVLVSGELAACEGQMIPGIRKGRVLRKP